MSSPKFDGVIEAVHYSGDGRVEQVRLYERRGAVYSDCLLIGREDLVRQIKAHKVFVAGHRRPFWGASFATGAEVRLVGAAGKEVLVTAGSPIIKDDLKGVPEY